MNRESLFRLALISHAQAPTTLKKYIVFIAKLVMTNADAMEFTAEDIARTIQSEYDLEFSDTEIVDALSDDDGFVWDTNAGTCYLKPEAFVDDRMVRHPAHTIDTYVDLFLMQYKYSLDAAIVKELILQYLYHAFNAGKRTMLSLLTGENAEIFDTYDTTDQNRMIINDFLSWEHDAKNFCIYRIVSYCIDYGMITSKKDLSVNVFQGNHFLLDSNIIFRLIGFNNAERKRLLQHFIQRCHDVNISLHYTNITYEEILRVLRNAVTYINRVNNGDKPLSPSDLEIIGLSDHKEIYALYYNWSKSNPFQDYQAFGAYLETLLNECIVPFHRIDMYNHEMDTGTRKEFETLTASLLEFKSQRKRYFISDEAVKTDINNFLYVKHLDEKDAGHYFIISTDTGYYEWAKRTLPSVPTVFMPGEWLSIILKYSSRTDESDYTTFCKFISLPNLQEKQKQIDKAKQILYSINEQTTNTELKSLIIHQIAKARHIYAGTDTAIVVKKAYSEVMEMKVNDQSEHNRADYDLALRDSIEALAARERELAAQVEAYRQEKKALEDRIALLDARMEAYVRKKVQTVAFFKKNIVLGGILASGLSYLMILLICKTGSLEQSIIAFCATSRIMKDNVFNMVQIIASVAALIIAVLLSLWVIRIDLVKYADKLRKRYRERYL